MLEDDDICLTNGGSESESLLMVLLARIKWCSLFKAKEMKEEIISATQGSGFKTRSKGRKSSHRLE